MNEPLISIIVPVYNGEAYIAKCFHSILNQTYQNLEIIIINDGSSDESPEICDYFARLDERIIVIHQENQGLSAVRNKGVQFANGDFIGFVDSDDQIHPRMYEKLYNLLINNDADLAMCNVEKVYQNQKNFVQKPDPQVFEKESITLLNRKEAFENLFNEHNLITVVPWNKLYRKSLFQQVNYPNGKVHDDEFVIHHLIQATRRIIYTDVVLYYYYHNEASFTNETYQLKRLDAIEALKDRVLFFESINETKLLKRTILTYLHLMIIHYYAVINYLPEEVLVAENLQITFRDEFHHYKKLMTKKERRELHFFSIHPSLYQSFIKLRQGVARYLLLNKT